ncbi:MAG: hypothetical protein A2941_02860 [Candidatus Yanofskybacteria bacterium RIFCSPLOWO2_01_FULL_49_17]|uniref:Uncharacterized protein n=1 Tax=Candidatus Yanofskybacteria bacterium RIFCSPLOWO2_01_FULL_49_17 TaxID=1802700 RepID=A0A1F8GR55_9BACT|nr:MAG: hypothetical protein A2941_02860 [Candidatus Yanofskybacteria bacterium RIFCSPLOWO2_01_FULL_49_17]
MRKILLISTPSSELYTPLRKTLEALGFEVHIVDFLDHDVLKIGHPVHRVVSKMPEMIREHLRGKAFKHIDERVLDAAQWVEPDYIFVSKAKNIDIPVLEHLRKIAPTINWYGSGMGNIYSIRKLVRHYDYFFNVDADVVQLMKKEGHTNVYFLPLSGKIEDQVRQIMNIVEGAPDRT